ncbi:hypothetical protein K439DRAFT_1350266 [Ramaria rubella]|nr:hypothetical protein K439DRAFT_1350266 [Ramaria rubella]
MVFSFFLAQWLTLTFLGLLSAGSTLASPLSESPSVNSNRGIFANLRIEGANHTIFEGLIFTRGHNVTTKSGGTHHCDGTNNNENLLPGPTATSALDDAADLAHFTWDGTFDTEFDDFFITRIAGSAQTSTQFWGILVNFQFTLVGGCQQEINKTDHVLWAFDAFNKVHFLQLTGPAHGNKNDPITFTVTDGSNDEPVAGASIEGHVTDAQGKVTLTFVDVGTKRLKAEKPDSLRSNALEVLITP